VKTELHREAKARKQSEQGMAPSAVAEATLKAIKRNRYETIIEKAKLLKAASRIAPGFFHRLLNKVAAG
jgi:short-subunit dehydrogenase